MVELTTTRLPPATCPACSYELDACSGPGRPNPGDITVCWGCGEVLSFDAELHQVRLPRAELEQLPQETKDLVARAQRLIRCRRAVGEVARA